MALGLIGEGQVTACTALSVHPHLGLHSIDDRIQLHFHTNAQTYLCPFHQRHVVLTVIALPDADPVFSGHFKMGTDFSRSGLHNGHIDRNAIGLLEGEAVTGFLQFAHVRSDQPVDFRESVRPLKSLLRQTGKKVFLHALKSPLQVQLGVCFRNAHVCQLFEASTVEVPVFQLRGVLRILPPELGHCSDIGALGKLLADSKGGNL